MGFLGGNLFDLQFFGNHVDSQNVVSCARNFNFFQNFMSSI